MLNILNTSLYYEEYQNTLQFYRRPSNYTNRAQLKKKGCNINAEWPTTHFLENRDGHNSQKKGKTKKSLSIIDRSVSPVV